MNRLISHIEFLLHTHDCVIVPALGGFVVNSISPSKDGLSAFNSPACELLFNRELTHNDGLLVESFMRTDGISFENATQKIEESVREIKSLLRTEKSVDLDDLGDFRMIDEQRFVYQPKLFVRPEHYGLAQASLKPIIQLQTDTKTGEKQAESGKSVLRKIGIGIAAAAVIAAVVFVFPFKDNTLGYQNAQIFSESGLLGHKTEKNTAGTTAIANVSAAGSISPKLTETVSAPAATEEVAMLSDAPKYYIVTGVYQVREYAADMLAKLQSEGFANAAIMERTNRIDVYAQYFSSRQEADENLLKFKKNFPNHHDAWILKK